MKKISVKQLWFFPLIFGLLGAFIGLVMRYAFTGGLGDFPFKFVRHSHSHVMLLGFVFNALIVLLFLRFTSGIDKLTYQIYLALQACVAVLLVGFIIEGYAFVTILFSTIHLWLSYILVIRLWRRLEGEKSQVLLIKIGIVFHLFSSIGPYALGPLMALHMEDSPWYQQAIFFYLHFQYFGSFFVWMLAVLFQKAQVKLSKIQLICITASLSLLYAHSLDFSFSNPIIQLSGILGSVVLAALFFTLRAQFSKQALPIKIIFYIALSISFFNCVGSVPSMTKLVVSNRFVLIAWLHLLFLGMYVPFIWTQLLIKVKPILWVFYATFIIITECMLVFPAVFVQLISISIMYQLFLAYLGVVCCISVVHLTALFSKKQFE